MMAVNSGNVQLIAECLNGNCDPFLHDELNRTALNIFKLGGLDGVTQRLLDLEGRVGKLETRADKSDKKLDAHDIDIEDLKRRLTAVEGMEMPAMPAMPEMKEATNLDTAGIMKQIQFIRNEFNTFKVEMSGKAPKIDIDKLRDELKEYTD